MSNTPGPSIDTPKGDDDNRQGQTARTTDTISPRPMAPLLNTTGEQRQPSEDLLTPLSPGLGELSRRRRSFMEKARRRPSGFYRPSAAEGELPINDFNVHGMPSEWAALNQISLKSLNDYTFHSKPGMVTRPGLEIFDNAEDAVGAYEDDATDISFERKHGSAPILPGGHRPKPVFRLLNRERPMKQSSGTMKIDRKNQLQSLYMSDFFHSVLDINTNMLIAGILFL
ncbi:G protein-activated inward rectifier potassium channel 2 [Perkinsus olseni]|uniref:G protein-activated inward rectifier potassium channel 2 n=1 Tax=Perkinsus olseni TaxID=32597 RepID=A0A7J6QUX1_PEROL|nr:G protein-activated inward rectifier potassium channel 2 [Perkinsus olseni]